MNQEERDRTGGKGSLIVHVSTARGAIPLEGAMVTVRNFFQEPEENRGDAVAVLVSGRDGNTPVLTLDAPPREESMEPMNGAPGLPYARYNLEVRLEGYEHQNYISVPIFDGILAIQPVYLIPIPENGSDGNREGTEYFYETEGPTL